MGKEAFSRGGSPLAHPGRVDSAGAVVTLACRAMASRFELVLQGDDEVWLRAAGEEALREIERLDRQLSRFRPSSDISRINSLAAEEPVRVAPQLFELLQTCERLYHETAGAFDITIAPLMRAWGFTHSAGSIPDPSTLEEARRCVGMHLVHLDADARTVRFERPEVMLDLGAIGKGYAVDEAMLILRQMGVTSAFLHGGTSTMAAIGRETGGAPWRIVIPYPGHEHDASEDAVLTIVELEDTSLSVSAVWGRQFEAEGETFGHVIDPRLGRPVDGAVLAGVVLPSATQADALSTALLVLGSDGKMLEKDRAELGAVVLLHGAKGGAGALEPSPGLVSTGSGVAIC